MRHWLEVDDPVLDLFVGDGSDGIDQRLQRGGSVGERLDSAISNPAWWPPPVL